MLSAVLEQHPMKQQLNRLLPPISKPSLLNKQNIRDTAGEATFIYGPQHMDIPVLYGHQEFIYVSSVRTQDTFWKTRREQWI